MQKLISLLLFMVASFVFCLLAQGQSPNNANAPIIRPGGQSIDLVEDQSFYITGDVVPCTFYVYHDSTLVYSVYVTSPMKPISLWFEGDFRYKVHAYSEKGPYVFRGTLHVARDTLPPGW